MRIKFNQSWDYAHNGIRVVRYQKDQVVDTDKEQVDATFVKDCCDRDKVASVVTESKDRKDANARETK